MAPLGRQETKRQPSPTGSLPLDSGQRLQPTRQGSSLVSSSRNSGHSVGDVLEGCTSLNGHEESFAGFEEGLAAGSRYFR